MNNVASFEGPQFLAALPLGLEAELDQASSVGYQFMLANRAADAFEIFRRSYELLLSSQPEGRRFHKGAPLHNMGWARLRSNMPDEGGHWTLLAYIEDCLSRAEELPRILDELSRPAAQNLRLLGAPEVDLVEIARQVRGLVAERILVQDPTTLYLQLALPERLLRWLGAARITPSIRVFVSSPRELRPERILVAETCRQLTMTMPARVEALLWEGAGDSNPECQSFPPEITGSGAQAVIDNHVWNRLGGYDVYVGLLWRRIGTPIGSWRSGTEAEFRFAFEQSRVAGRPTTILFYVKDLGRRTTRSTETSDFIDELRGLGLVTRFGTRENFRRAIFDHLVAVVRERLA